MRRDRNVYQQSTVVGVVGVECGELGRGPGAIEWTGGTCVTPLGTDGQPPRVAIGEYLRHLVRCGRAQDSAAPSVPLVGGGTGGGHCHWQWEEARQRM